MLKQGLRNLKHKLLGPAGGPSQLFTDNDLLRSEQEVNPYLAQMTREANDTVAYNKLSGPDREGVSRAFGDPVSQVPPKYRN